MTKISQYIFYQVKTICIRDPDDNENLSRNIDFKHLPEIKSTS